MTRLASLMTLLLVALGGCAPALIPVPQSVTATPQPLSATPAATATPTATHTRTPSATPAPSFTPTPTWAWNSGQPVVAPILLYHHVSDEYPGQRYTIQPAVFRQQMEQLLAWGYTGITISTLVNVILHGGELPARPVVITFDDGNRDVYENAFPILRELGIPATDYLIASELGAPGYVNADQAQELITAGWEIGSHSLTHVDLRGSHARLEAEVERSRSRLEAELGVRVRTFSFPYGVTDPTVTQEVQRSGYLSGVGLGVGYTHSWQDLYYLSRIEVRAEYDLEQLGGMLPWDGPLPLPTQVPHHEEG